ncbi:replication initiation factor domain-containing protein, partial [Enterococcus faecalis]|nr:replication initiation factor domain-containing protein [Enterococcus faecalis]
IKNRYELRFANEKAFLFVEYFLSSGETLEWLVKEIINHALVVYDLEDGKKVFCKDWYNVVDKMEGLSLSVAGEKPSIEKTARWVRNYLAPSLKMMKIVDAYYGTNELEEYIDSAELKEKHVEILETICVDVRDLLFGNESNSKIREYLKQEFTLEEEEEFLEEYPF